jgi:hypothetical protein
MKIFSLLFLMCVLSGCVMDNRFAPPKNKIYTTEVYYESSV